MANLVDQTNQVQWNLCFAVDGNNYAVTGQPDANNVIVAGDLTGVFALANLLGAPSDNAPGNAGTYEILGAVYDSENNQTTIEIIDGATTIGSGPVYVVAEVTSADDLQVGYSHNFSETFNAGQTWEANTTFLNNDQIDIPGANNCHAWTGGLFANLGLIGDTLMAECYAETAFNNLNIVVTGNLNINNASYALQSCNLICNALTADYVYDVGNYSNILCEDLFATNVSNGVITNSSGVTANNAIVAQGINAILSIDSSVVADYIECNNMAGVCANGQITCNNLNTIDCNNLVLFNMATVNVGDIHIDRVSTEGIGNNSVIVANNCIISGDMNNSKMFDNQCDVTIAIMALGLNWAQVKDGYLDGNGTSSQFGPWDIDTTTIGPYTVGNNNVGPYPIV